MSDLKHKLESFGWGLFFIWLGVVYLANLGPGIGLLGIGIITVGAQLVRKSYNLKMEGFWLVVGLLFLLAGCWDLFNIKLNMVPIIIILAGVVLISGGIRGKKQ